MIGIRVLVCCLLFAGSSSLVQGQETPPRYPGTEIPALPVAYLGDPGYPTKPGNGVIILPGDPGYPAHPYDPVILYPAGPGDPIFIWPGDPGYPYNPGDPILIWPGDPYYPYPPFVPGDPIIVFPWDPGYPTFPIFPGDPIIVYPGNPGYPALPNDPRFPPIIVQPGGPGYPVQPGDPITVFPGDPGYPGNPGVPPGGVPGEPGEPGTPGYRGDPTIPGNPVTSWTHGASGPDGQRPHAGLLLANDGFLYGTTKEGGANGCGVVFRVDTSGHNYAVMHTFRGGDGSEPTPNLILIDGWIYGTTQKGGDYDCGVIFQLDITGQRSGRPIESGERHWRFFTTHQFWYPTGAVPIDGLTLGQDGSLYGTTSFGGANDTQHLGRGTVFKFDILSRTYTVLHNFQTTVNFYAPDGITPSALVQGPDGYLYGTTQRSPRNASESYTSGTVFKIQTNGSHFQTLHPFHSGGNPSDGAMPLGRLLVAADGLLYGTTFHGAISGSDPNSVGFGSVFRLSASGQNYAQLHAFGRVGNQADLLHPAASLIQGADGNLYGTTVTGDSTGGAVYRIGTDGTGFQQVHAFTFDDSCGRSPKAPLVQDADGNLYGTTSSGSSEGFGAVFKITPGGQAYALHRFGTPVDNPDDPGGSIVSSVHLLSLTLQPTSVTGGTNSTGTVVLDAPAPLQGAVVALATNNTAAKVFRTVVIAAGQTTGTFTVTTRAVGTATTANVSATYNGASLSAPLIIVPPVLLSLSLNPDKVTSGANSVGIVTLSGPAPDGGLVVNLTSSLTSAVTVPSAVLVRAGANGNSFLAATSSVTNVVTSSVVGTLDGVSKTATLTVMPGFIIPANVLADASVLAGSNSANNYGQQPALVTQTDASSTSSSNAVTYLKFDLSNAHVAPTSATLKLTVNGLSVPTTGFARVRVYGVQDTTWQEETITWANAPSLNRSSVTSTGTLLTTQDVPLSGGVAAFDVTAFVVGHLGHAVTFQIVNDAPDGLRLGVNSKEAASGHPALILTSSFLNDVPAPLWALNVIPTDSSPSGGGPSSSDSVNLASGVEENTPGPDIAGRNPIGPTAGFSRLYRSVLAAKGYASPGLSPGWTHNYDIRVQGAAGAWIPLTMTYPNGAQEVWGPELDANNAPTGALLPGGAGTPYLVQGIPSPTTAGRWLTLTITYKDHTSWTFTPDPRNPDFYLLTRLTSPVGRSLYLVYDETHRLLKATDDSNPTNTLLSFQYSAGYLSSITEPFGRSVNFTFGQTAGGMCLTAVSQISSSAPQWQYDYTAINGWPMLSSVGVPDPTAAPVPNGGATPMRSHPITYYPDGRVATMVDANGNRRLYTYQGGTQVQVYSPSGNLVDHWEQASGALNNGTGYTDANNASSQVAYADPANPYRPTQYLSKDLAHQQIISATYDQYGSTLTTQATCNGGLLKTFYHYDYSTFKLGLLDTVSQASEAGVVRYTYYPNGLRKTVTIPKPGSGQASVAPNVSESTVTYYYTALGNISMVTKPAPSATSQLVSYSYNYIYDPLDQTRSAEVLGQPLTVTDPSGAVTHYRYDARGNRTAIIDALGNRIDFVYNIADQLVSTVLPATGQTGTGRAHTDITYQYLGGPAIATVAFDESNAPVRHVEQVSGKEGEALTQTGNTEKASLDYDAQQRLTSLKDGNGHAFVHDYDAVGNLTQLTYPSGASVHGQYGPDGNVTQSTNARGQTTTATLALNDTLLQSLLHADGHSEHFAYDGLGRSTQVSDGTTTLDYTYDDLNNILSVTTTYANLNMMPVTVYYGYNPDGSRAYMQGGPGTTLYSYDSCGRLTDVWNTWKDGTYHFDYDKLGRLIHKKNVGTETFYSFNAASQLVGVTNYDSAQNVISAYSDLRYDGAGNLLKMDVTTPPLTPGPLTRGTITYNYDSQDRLTHELSRRDLAVPGLVGAFGNYDYASASDAADNLTQLRGVTQTSNADNQITSDGNNGPAYAYDLDGNPTTEEGATLQYDDANHLTAYDNIATNTHIRMGYRPDGLRAWKQVNDGPRTYFFYDGERLSMEIVQGTGQEGNAAVVSRAYGWGAAGLEQVDYANSSPEYTLFYAFDPQGNVASRVLNRGGALDQVFYDAFGKVVGDWAYDGSGSWLGGQDVVGWGGQWGAYTDVESFASGQMGLVLLTHRYYNPDTGRFLTRDPMGYEGGVNVYAYVRNNPVSFVDPSGLNREDWMNWARSIGKIGMEIAMGIGGAALFPANPIMGAAIGTAVVDGLWAYIVEGKSPAEAAVTALRSGVLVYIGGKAAEKLIGAVLRQPAVQKFLAKYGGNAANFVKELLNQLNGGCFLAGTPVQVLATEEMSAFVANSDTAMSEPGIPLLGLPVATKPIEQIQSGDKVATRNPDTGKTEFKRVVATKVRIIRTLFILALADKATGKVVETITTTPEHPFNVAGKGFTAAINLAVGNAIVTRAGPALLVQSITPDAHPEGVPVYNFEVEDDHTYFVGTANGGTWVHNDCFTRVGRWMSQAEYDVMVAEGKVTSTSGGLDAKSVTNPPRPDAFRAAAPGSVFVEFDVPTASLAQGGKSGWSTVYGPNSVYGRLAAKRGNPITSMPEARNIIIRTRK